MPHISDAMAASLRGRDITGEVTNVKNAFSSWDNCMAATYCKWPVVAMIIIAGLIVLSVVWCIVRCACCGLSCCCSCFSCLKCCGNCCGCCDDPRGKKHKHLDEPYFAPNAGHAQQGYQPHAPMTIGGASPFDPPKFAQFETGPSGLAVEPAKSQVSDDALPPMPSWDTAAKKKVALEEEKDAMELGDLDHTTGQKVPLMSGAMPISRSGSPGPNAAHSPYGDHPDQNGYMGAGGFAAGAAMGAGAGAGAMATGGRGGPNDQYARNVPGQYGAGPMGGRGGRGGPNDQFGRGGPNRNQYNNQGGRGGYGGPNQPTSPNGSNMQNPYDQYNQDQGYQNNNPGAGGFGAVAPYGRGQRQYSNDSGRPFPPSGPQRQYSNDSNRPLMPAGMPPGQQRGYANNEAVDMPFPEDHYAAPQPMRAPARIPSPGFDFNSNSSSRGPAQSAYGGNGGGRPSPPLGQQQQQGYDAYDRRPSPPQPQYHGSSPPGQGIQRQNTGGYSIASTAPPTYASRSPPPQAQLPMPPNPTAQGAYPGYKPYAPSGQGRQGPPGPPGRSNTGGNGWN